jgi:hypothetical protein
MITLRHGTIFRLGPDGMGYLFDEDSGESFVFRASQVVGGLAVSDLNGAPASFELDEQQQVTRVSVS